MNIRKILVIIALLGVVFGLFIVYKVYATFFEPNTSFNNEEAYVYIGKDDGFEEVVTQLSPLLKDPQSFVKTATQKGYDQYVKAGKYRITKGMNNNDIINTIRSGNLPVKVSFNNQETIYDLAGRIAAQIDADSIELVEAFTDKKFYEDNLLTDETVLSVFVPNSYECFWNTSAEGFRDKMLKEYKKFWNADRLAKAEKKGLSPQEVIVLASIVHKETVKKDERPRVAGVYLNRLKKPMLLQADPTVIYAKKKKENNFDQVIKRVLYKDLEIDSPYNTYKYAGLPPGPIAMPDISAIDAVLNAENHRYLYFVADVKKVGYHKFAKSLAQHNINRREYVDWINKKRIMR